MTQLWFWTVLTPFFWLPKEKQSNSVWTSRDIDVKQTASLNKSCWCQMTKPPSCVICFLYVSEASFHACKSLCLCVITLLESGRLACLCVSGLRVTTGIHLIIFITRRNMSAFPRSSVIALSLSHTRIQTLYLTLRFYLCCDHHSKRETNVMKMTDFSHYLW